MKKVLNTAFLFSLIIQSIFAETYKVPPSSTTYGSVPVISDKAMEYCVKVYNEAKWLESDINSMYVNQYSQSSIDAYNAKVNKHSTMINYFNQYCAGKQSESAYRAARNLNAKND